MVHPAAEGMPTYRVAYFFSGAHRKGSVAHHLLALCVCSRHGLDFHEVDIMVGGSAHDLLGRSIQDEYIALLDEGYFHFALFSPPLRHLVQSKLE